MQPHAVPNLPQGCSSMFPITKFRKATQKHFLRIAKKDDPQVLNMNVGLVVSPAHVRSGDLVQLGVSKCSKPTKPRDPRATNLIKFASLGQGLCSYFPSNLMDLGGGHILDGCPCAM